jgi:hypothetical protein
VIFISDQRQAVLFPRFFADAAAVLSQSKNNAIKIITKFLALFSALA